MSERANIRDLINNATEGLVDMRTGLEGRDIDRRIIPNLAAEAAKYAIGAEERKALGKVLKLLKHQDIGIAVRSKDHAPGEVPDISVDIFRAAGEREAYTLRFLVNGTIAYQLESGDDRGKAVLNMKNVMMEAYQKWIELKKGGVFKPVRETW